MDQDALATFSETLRRSWGPISTELVATCRSALATLSRTSETEAWLARLHGEKPASRELMRDPTFGFMLLAHIENQGLFRPPHDHGRAWVVYAVQSGALEVRTYAKVAEDNGPSRLVLRDATVLRPGDAKAYLPGDIHDTRCLTETALLLRFTERDLRHEDQVEHRLTRFIEGDGQWIPSES